MNKSPDWSALRKDFPILSRTARGKPLVYLDNAATSQKPLPVLQALQDFWTEENANVHRGVHYLSELATAKFDAARETAATAINIHVEALQQIRQWPSLCLTYALPWDREPDKNTTLILSLTRDYVSKHKDEFRPETLCAGTELWHKTLQPYPMKNFAEFRVREVL